jgi:hypothetical protein
MFVNAEASEGLRWALRIRFKQEALQVADPSRVSRSRERPDRRDGPLTTLTIHSMAATVQVEINGELLERLRARHLGKSDRELIERLATIELGMAALRESQRRNALSEEEAMDLAVRAVHEARDADR